MTTVTTQLVTPSMASEFLAIANYDDQRPTRPLWTKYLADEMALGSFKQNTLIEFVRVKKSRKLHLIDGQHRLGAVIRSGKPQTFVVLETEVESDEDAARLYYRIDQGLKRGAVDQLRVLEIGNEYNLNYTELRRLAGAVTLIGSDWSRVRQQMFHPDERERLVKEYAPACRRYFDTIVRRPSDMKSATERAATLAVAVVTFRFSVEKFEAKVEDFWEGAVFDDGVLLGDARKAANRHLVTVGMQGGASTGNAIHRSPAYSARYLARCFNAYVKGEPLKYPKVLDTTSPMLILGSPFNGK